MRHTEVAAIFDVDGTLITGPTLERTFYRFLYRTGELGPKEIAAYVKGLFEGVPLRVNRCHLRGKSESGLRRLARLCFEQEVRPALLPRALDRVRLHRISGHQVVLISGTLDILLEPLAEFLGAVCSRGTRLETANGLLTGRIDGVHPYAEEKVTSLVELKNTCGFDLHESFAYGNHNSDRYVLSAVGHAVATNADRRLRRLALARGWIIEDFTSRPVLHDQSWLSEEAL